MAEPADVRLHQTLGSDVAPEALMVLTPSSVRSTELKAALVATPSRATTPRPPTGTLDLIAVTRRPAVRLRIAAVSAQVGLPAPVFCDRVDEVIARSSEIAVIILDLASCCRDAGLPRLIWHWTRRWPDSELVLFAPLLDPDTELETTLTLLRAAGDAGLRVMTASDFYRDEVWQTVAAVRASAVLERELRAELLAAVAHTGRPMRAASDVLDLLAVAPRHAMATARNAALRASLPVAAAQTADVRAADQPDRKVRWKQLRRAGQMPASCLLLMFRVLWYVKLRQIGWPTARVAEFLGFTSPREFRRSIRRRLGLGVRDLRRLCYTDALACAADLLVTAHERGSATMRAVAGALQRVSRTGRASDRLGTSPRTQKR